MGRTAMICFACLFFCLELSTALMWGSWSAERTANENFDFVDGSYYVDLRSIISISHSSIFPNTTSELTSKYLSNVNVFFTSYVSSPQSTLSTSEEAVLHDWIQIDGGVLVIGGCHQKNYASCQSYLRPFGLNVEDSYTNGNIVSSCSAEHPLLSQVEEMYHGYPEYLVVGDTEATPLCTLPDGEVVVAVLQYGNGHILFSDMQMYNGCCIGRYDNAQFVSNMVFWTEQLTCPNNDACPQIHIFPGECNFGSVECEDTCGTYICESGSGCVLQSRRDCNDHNVCTIDSCDPEVGCVSEPANCNTHDICMIDSCNPTTGCVSEPIDCEDGDACTGGFCNPSTGCESQSLHCDDNNVCTIDSCDPVIGCVFEQIVCDDHNLCTANLCDPAAGCIFGPPNCDDGNACTIDVCDINTGCFSEPVICDDHDECTSDYCNPTSGCLYEDPQDCYPTMMETADLIIESHPAVIDAALLVHELEESIDHIKESLDLLLSSIIPTQTQPPTSIPTPTTTQTPSLIPTSNPTAIPTPASSQTPTRVPAQCDASQYLTREDFISEDGCCFSQANTCFADTICGDILDEQNCAIPNGVLYGPRIVGRTLAIQVRTVVLRKTVVLYFGQS